VTQILLLGSWHFRENGDLLYTEDVQRQLRDINARLAEFSPDAVAVEAPPREQAAADSSYAKFSLDDLDDFEKMRTGSLGRITMFGETHDITYDNEAVQIGYRLGKTLGLGRIHAVDDDAVLEDIRDEILGEIREITDRHSAEMCCIEENLADRLRFYNSDEWSRRNHQLYVALNAVGTGTTYEGARFNGDWYVRNFKIFANIQKLCGEYKRIFIVYGAGHLHILRELINADESMELVDWREYL